jgi:hypothetical protein
MRSVRIDNDFLTSTLDGGEWSTSRYVHFIHGEGPHRYPFDMRLGRPRTDLYKVEEMKILAPTGTRTPTSLPSSPQTVPIPTEASWLPLIISIAEQTRWTYTSLNEYFSTSCCSRGGNRAVGFPRTTAHVCLAQCEVRWSFNGKSLRINLKQNWTSVTSAAVKRQIHLY